MSAGERESDAGFARTAVHSRAQGHGYTIQVWKNELICIIVIVMDNSEDSLTFSAEFLAGNSAYEGKTQMHHKGIPEKGKEDGRNKRRRGSEFFDDVAEEDDEQVSLGKSSYWSMRTHFAMSNLLMITSTVLWELRIYVLRGRRSLSSQEEEEEEEEDRDIVG